MVEAFKETVDKNHLMTRLKSVAVEYYDWYKKSPCSTNKLWCKAYWSSFSYGPCVFWVIIRHNNKRGKKILKLWWHRGGSCARDPEYFIYDIYGNMEQSLIDLVEKLKADTKLKVDARQAQIQSYVSQLESGK